MRLLNFDYDYTVYITRMTTLRIHTLSKPRPIYYLKIKGTSKDSRYTVHILENKREKSLPNTVRHPRAFSFHFILMFTENLCFKLVKRKEKSTKIWKGV